MYEPENRSSFYLFIFISLASLLGFSFFVFYKPMIIDTSCSEIASVTSNLLFKEQTQYGEEFSFYNVKTDCVLKSE